MLVNLKQILKPADENGFAVPAFNVSSNMILRGVMQGCGESKSPVILAIHPSELRFTTDSFVAAVRQEAFKARLPVCIHLDHGASFGQVIHAISLGFTSVMIDASTQPFEENVALTKKVVEAAHAAGVSVEAELGTIGATGNGGEAGTENIIYTDPEDAKAFVRRTGIDALAVAIGTAHGIYPKGKKPALRLDLIEAIRAGVGVPLVLHGGSDNPDGEIARAVRLGISKINISSDTKAAFYKKCREVLEDPAIREPMEIYPPCIEAMEEIVCRKIRLFGADNKADLYR